jgi:uroporphyrinogen-III synthase
MKVLVTRPAAQAAEWVAQLAAPGIDAAALPLIGIAAPADRAPVEAAWAALAGQALVVFVSPNAVEQFFALRPAAAAWPAGVVAGSPGPGTTSALRACGVPPGQIVAPADDAPQFDSEALWVQLAGRDWQRARVTIVRGDGGREWLADTLRAQGAEVSFVAAYRRVPPEPDARQAALLRQAVREPGRHLWFFSSSEAIDHLVALAPDATWGSARALATHPRIADRARRVGFGAVSECRPALAAVVACIQSMDP